MRTVACTSTTMIIGQPDEDHERAVSAQRVDDRKVIGRVIEFGLPMFEWIFIQGMLIDDVYMIEISHPNMGKMIKAPLWISQGINNGNDLQTAVISWLDRHYM